MKTLITAADINQMAKGSEKILYVPPRSIITPAARDAAKEWGIKIVVSRAATPDASETAPSGAIGRRATDCAAGSINAAIISQIVGEVLANLNIAGAPRLLIKEADPCGLRLVRGNSIVLENYPANAGEKVKRKELFSTQDSPFMSAGLAALEEANCICDIQQDEIYYILDGVVTVTVQGREYTASRGDVLFIPAGAKVTFATREKAKWFFVTHTQKQ